MVKYRVVLCSLLMLGLLAAATPASAQVNSSGFSFGTTIVLSKFDDNGRILMTLFGFYADNSGATIIDVKCPLTQPGDKVAAYCNDDIQVGTELTATTGTPPDTASDYPTRYGLRSITLGTPVNISAFSGQSLAPEFGGSIDPLGVRRPELFGDLRSVVAA